MISPFSNTDPKKKEEEEEKKNNFAGALPASFRGSSGGLEMREWRGLLQIQRLSPPSQLESGALHSVDTISLPLASTRSVKVLEKSSSQPTHCIPGCRWVATEQPA